MRKSICFPPLGATLFFCGKTGAHGQGQAGCSVRGSFVYAFVRFMPAGEGLGNLLQTWHGCRFCPGRDNAVAGELLEGDLNFLLITLWCIVLGCR